MDLMSPLVHEFTYQAMAMDLLPIRDDEDKVRYRNTIKKGTPDQEERDVEIGENDKIWVANRHMHMKDLLGKIVADFNKFRAENPQFAEQNDQKISVNTIKDMLAGLPQFQEGKEAFGLHLEMAEKCVSIFQSHKLPDIASVEQSLATGFDEEYHKPRNLADQVVRLLDDDSVVHEDRLRLLVLYILYRNGLFRAISKNYASMLNSRKSTAISYTIFIILAGACKGISKIRPYRRSSLYSQCRYPHRIRRMKKSASLASSQHSVTCWRPNLQAHWTRTSFLRSIPG